MQFLNHYSAVILAALLLGGALSLVLRRGGRMRHWLVLIGVTVVLVAAWWVFRPVERWPEPLAGPLPLLLEIQSPYCLGCVAQRPAVDRLEKEWRGKLVIQRVDIQSAEGRKLAHQYGVELTPTFIFFDKTGQEQWRNSGQLDAARVRSIVNAPTETRQ